MARMKWKIASIVGAGFFLVGALVVYLALAATGGPVAAPVRSVTTSPAASRPTADADAAHSDVASLIRQCRQNIAQQRYADALVLIDRILQIDPENDYANGVRPLVADRADLQNQRRQPNP